MAVVLLGEGIVTLMRSDPNSDTFYLGIATSLPFILGIVYAGYWLAEGDLPPDRYHDVGRWWIAGMGVAVLIILPINATIRPVSGMMIVGTIRWSAALGGGIGLLLGVFQARAIDQAAEIGRINERARIRLDDAGGDPELLQHLEYLFTDEIRPLVTGIADGVTAGDDPRAVQRTAPDEQSLAHRARRLDAITRHVEAVLTTEGVDSGLAPMNLVAAIRTAATELTDDRPDADVTIGTAADADAPPEVFVRADRALPELFVDLFEDVCAHSEHPTPRISVGIDGGPDTVRIRIADNDAGVPDRSSAFEYDSPPEGGRDLGVVGMLIGYYGGTVRVDETSGEPVVAIELQRVLIGATPDGPGREPTDATRSAD